MTVLCGSELLNDDDDDDSNNNNNDERRTLRSTLTFRSVLHTSSRRSLLSLVPFLHYCNLRLLLLTTAFHQ